eukprot:3982429-Pyramimonas_sp.AAC.1
MKTARMEMTEVALPLPTKIRVATKEPLSFKDGRAAAFCKGRGSIALALNQRSILITNTLSKLHHRHLRALSVDYLYMALLTQQCGGLPGRSRDLAAHFVKCFWGAAACQRPSVGPLFVDLTAAFLLYHWAAGIRPPRGTGGP